MNSPRVIRNTVMTLMSENTKISKLYNDREYLSNKIHQVNSRLDKFSGELDNRVSLEDKILND